MPAANPDRAAEEVLAILKNHYIQSSAPAVPEMLDQLLKDAQQTRTLLSKLCDLLDFSLQKLRKNPAYHFSQDQLSKLTARETEVLQSADKLAVQSFLGYFEIALATVRGTNTREYLLSYRGHAGFLEKLLKAFQVVLQSAHSQWK